jgi:hypothetical protein
MKVRKSLGILKISRIEFFFFKIPLLANELFLAARPTNGRIPFGDF